MFSRVNPSMLNFIEKPVLCWISRRLPHAVTPDKLTIIGLIGAIISFASYAIASNEPAFIWLACAGIIINWFGDSLDGTLARFRKIERPRYGFYLDHTVDLFSQFFIGAGLALSGMVNPFAACLALILYLMIVAAAVIKQSVTGRLIQSMLGIGPTEIRLAIITMSLFVFYTKPVYLFELAGIKLTALDLIIISSSIISFIGLIVDTSRQIQLLKSPNAELDGQEDVASKPTHPGNYDR